ncbi:MAG: amidohydrolase family protein, partial [Imperialibacter sp.]
PVEIIKMGTLNAAEMMSAQDSLGSIEVGKIANMVLLNKNPIDDINNTLLINSVIKRGRIQKRLDQ